MGEKPTEVDEEADRHVSAIKMPPEQSGQDERRGIFQKVEVQRTQEKSSPELMRGAGVIKMPPDLTEAIPMKGEGGGSASEKAAPEKGVRGNNDSTDDSTEAIRNFSKTYGD